MNERDRAQDSLHYVDGDELLPFTYELIVSTVPGMVLIVQRQLRAYVGDIGKLALGVHLTQRDVLRFATNDPVTFWANGLDNKEQLRECIRLFRDLTEITTFLLNFKPFFTCTTYAVTESACRPARGEAQRVLELKPMHHIREDSRRQNN